MFRNAARKSRKEDKAEGGIQTPESLTSSKREERALARLQIFLALIRWQTAGFWQRLSSLEEVRRPWTKARIEGSNGCKRARGAKVLLRHDIFEANTGERAMGSSECRNVDIYKYIYLFETWFIDDYLQDALQIERVSQRSFERER